MTASETMIDINPFPASWAEFLALEEAGRNISWIEKSFNKTSHSTRIVYQNGPTFYTVEERYLFLRYGIPTAEDIADLIDQQSARMNREVNGYPVGEKSRL